MRTGDPLLSTLRDPAAMTSLSPPQWEAVLARALTSALTPALARGAGTVRDSALPVAVKRQFTGASVLVAHNHRQIMWEVNRVALVLRGIDAPVILLKGAAYYAAGLPLAEGRYASDVDILVPKDAINIVETALEDAGWESVKQDPYDERYYRQWMHEIPPLRHRERGTYLDVHHTILPESGRLSPDTDRLFEHAEPLSPDTAPPGAALYTLSPADMTLHAIVHWIQDGDLDQRLRDLVDIHAMLTDFGKRPGFWGDLMAASRAHGLDRPLYYALTFSHSLLGTEIPAEIWQDAQRARPPGPVDRTMRTLVPRAVLPDPLTGPTFGAKLARFLLFVRAHWLRMPPLTLARHLGRKALMRWRRQA